MLDRHLTLRVQRITELTAEVKAFELVHPAGRALPGYRAGAHVDVHLPGGFMRSYSLAEAPPAPPAAPLRYLIGVKREPQSRGGCALAGPQRLSGMKAVASTSMRTWRLGSMPLTSTTVLTGGSPG